MTNRPALALLLVAVVLLAGCNGLGFGPSSEDTTPPPGDDPTPNQQESEGFYDASTDTDEIVLRLSDIDGDYDPEGESRDAMESVEGETKENFERRGILLRHSRSFSRASGDGPLLVLSEVTLFDTVGDASSRYDEIVQTVRESGGSAEQIEVVSGVSGDLLTFENDRGAKVTMVLVRVDNLVLMTVTTATEDYNTQTNEELMVKMVADV